MLLYSEAGAILTELSRSMPRSTIKSLCLSNWVLSDKRAVFALVCQSLKFGAAIKIIVEKANFILPGDEKKTPTLESPKESRDPAPVSLFTSTLYTLVYDALFSGGRKIQGGARVGRAVPKKADETDPVLPIHRLEEDGVNAMADAVRSSEKELNAALEWLMKDAGVTNTSDLETFTGAPPTPPRYARVNGIKTTTGMVIKALAADGWVQAKAPGKDLTGGPEWFQKCVGTTTPEKKSKKSKKSEMEVESSDSDSDSDSDSSDSSDSDSDSDSSDSDSEAEESESEEEDKEAPKYDFVGCHPEFRVDSTARRGRKKAATTQFFLDPHVQGVLVFPPGTDLHAHALVKTGKIVLQGKSSCMSAAALAPSKGATVLDACAAPGNKTFHAAALVGPFTKMSDEKLKKMKSDAEKQYTREKPRGQVYAFDQAGHRLKILVGKTGILAASNVTATMDNWLHVDLANPTYMKAWGAIVDPSCSGSGLTTRQDALVQLWGDANETSSPKRLAGLAHFQSAAVLHAMKHPTISKVVYSTCSVNIEENEDVVTDVLRRCNDNVKHGFADFKKKLSNITGDDWKVLGFNEEDILCPGDFELVTALPQWPRRGTVVAGSEVEGSKTVRVDPTRDCATGFYVAAFQREVCKDNKARIQKVQALLASRAGAQANPKRTPGYQGLDDFDYSAFKKKTKKKENTRGILAKEKFAVGEKGAAYKNATSSSRLKRKSKKKTGTRRSAIA